MLMNSNEHGTSLLQPNVFTNLVSSEESHQRFSEDKTMVQSQTQRFDRMLLRRKTLHHRKKRSLGPKS